MASISKPPPIFYLTTYSSSSHPRPCSVTLSFPFCITSSSHARLCAFKSGSNGGSIFGNHDSYGPDLLRKPVISPRKDLAGIMEEEDDTDHNLDEDKWVDWEDKILEDTVPLVGFVRMILHTDKYRSGDRLSPEHEKTILERLLPFHPEFEKKVGCGIDYITVGYHPDFESSRCLFIVQKDGQLVDFSYWKCIKGLIRTNYPLYADSFILRHFRQRRLRL